MTNKQLVVKNKTEIQDNTERATKARYFKPDVDIFENNEAIYLVADMPGVQKKNVKVNLEDNSLWINGEIDPSIYEGMQPLYGEYKLGHYERRFSINENIETSKIEATVENGVLTVVMPKTEKVKASVIKVK